MADPILKVHGALATGIMSREDDGRWRTSLLVRDIPNNRQQMRGPEMLGSEAAARAWLVREAAHHGFKEDEFDIQVEGI